MRSRLQSCSAPDSGRATDGALVVDRAGGRSVLRRQHIGYPLHITRGFRLDAARTDLLTLYLQSASGGLYAGDRINLDVTISAGAAFHLTTQAATVVHDGGDVGATQRLAVVVGEGAFGALTTDPYVLFPGARLELETSAIVADDAVLLLSDGFAVHDPKAGNRTFGQFASRLVVTRPDGRLVMKDAGRIEGHELRSGALGPMAASGNVLLIAPSDRLPPVQELQHAADRCGALAGASIAPNGSGIALRVLAADGGTLARAMDAAFHVLAKAALGVELARRRK